MMCSAVPFRSPAIAVTMASSWTNLGPQVTQQIAQTLYDALDPIGVMVVIEAEHTCMTLRGVKKPGAVTITSTVLGGFRKDPRTRAEAMSLIKG